MAAASSRAPAVVLAGVLLLGCGALVPSRGGLPADFGTILTSYGLTFAPIDEMPAGMVSGDIAKATAQRRVSPERGVPSPPVLGLASCLRSANCPLLPDEVEPNLAGRAVPVWVVDFPGEVLLFVDAESGATLLVVDR